MEKEIFIYHIDDFDELLNSSWGRAFDTLLDVREVDKEEELINHLNDILENCENGLEQTKLNDYLWFDRDSILEELGIEEEVDD